MSKTQTNSINGFSETDVRLKIQAYVGKELVLQGKKVKEYSLIVAYIESTRIMDRLDDEFGWENWEKSYEPLQTGSECQGRSIIRIKKNGKVIKEVDGIGIGKDHKEAESDSFKRACRSLPKFNRFLWQQRQVIARTEDIYSAFKYGAPSLQDVKGKINAAKMEIHYDFPTSIAPPKSDSVDTGFMAFVYQLEHAQTTKELQEVVKEVKKTWKQLDVKQKEQINEVIKKQKAVLKDGIEELSDQKKSQWQQFVGDSKPLMISMANLQGKLVSKKRVLDYVNQVHGDSIKKRCGISKVESRKQIPIALYDDVMTWIKNEIERFKDDLKGGK